MDNSFLKSLINKVFKEYEHIDGNYIKRKNYIINLFGLCDEYDLNDEIYKIKYFNPKFYINLQNRLNMVEDGDNIIERIFIKTEDENFYKHTDNNSNQLEKIDYNFFELFPNHHQYTLDEFIEIYDSEKYQYFVANDEIKFHSLLLTNDEYLLQKCLYAINIDELLKLTHFPYNKNKIRLNINSFRIESEFMINVIKILSGYLISANTNFEDDVLVDNDKTYYGGIVLKNWTFNKNFDFLKIQGNHRRNYDDKGLVLSDFTKTTILFFHYYLKDDLFKIFSEPNLWQTTKKGLKYYVTSHRIRIYIDSIVKLKTLFNKEQNLLEFINIEKRIDNNLYFEYFIKNYAYVGYLDPNDDSSNLFYEEITDERIKYYSCSKYRDECDTASEKDANFNLDDLPI